MDLYFKPVILREAEGNGLDLVVLEDRAAQDAVGRHFDHFCRKDERPAKIRT
ncbi:MAG: hypothetical protein ACOYKN_20700 [Pirellula sp.]|jgi:hypothetical protein